MIRLSALSVALAAIAFTTTSPGTEETPAKKETKVATFCPVAGNPGNRKSECACPNGYCPLKPTSRIEKEFEGGKVQFCCGACPDIFSKNAEKFAHYARHQFVVSGQAKQVKCPVTGDKVSATISHDIGGVMVSFANEEALKKIKALDAPKAIQTIFGKEAFAKGFEMVKK